MSWAHFHNQFAYFVVYEKSMYLSHARNYGQTMSSVLLMTNSKIHLAKIKQWIFHNEICLAAWIGHLFQQISVFASLMMVDTLTWNSILPSQHLPMTAEKQVTGCTKSLVSCRVEIHLWRLIIHISNTGHDMTSCYQVPWGLSVSLLYGWWHTDSSASRSGGG